MVARSRASGVATKTIAALLRIDETTLRRECRRELADGREMLKAALSNVVVRRGLAGDWRAAIGWLARFSDEWKKPQVHLIGGVPGNPIAVAHEVRVFLPDNGRRSVVVSEPAPAIADSELEDDPIPLG